MRSRERSKLGRGVDIIDFEDSEKRNKWIREQFRKPPEAFIKSIIKEYHDLIHDVNLEFEDLIQEGWIALIKSAKRYDPSQRVEFNTFTYPRVQGRIIRSFAKEFKDDQAKWEYGYGNSGKNVARSAYIQKHLEEMDRQEREILNLYSEGYSTREIAGEIEDDISPAISSNIPDSSEKIE